MNEVVTPEYIIIEKEVIVIKEIHTPEYILLEKDNEVVTPEYITIEKDNEVVRNIFNHSLEISIDSQNKIEMEVN